MADILVEITASPTPVITVDAPPALQVSVTPPEPIQITVSTMGERGPKGDKGDPGEGGIATKTVAAGENISSGATVVLQGGKAYKFNPNDLNHLGRVLGITRTSGLTDAQITVQTNGECYDAAYELTPEKPCFCDAEGRITTNVPATKIIQPLGVALDAKTLYLNILTPIKT